jgi:hypothetical protein
MSNEIENAYRELTAVLLTLGIFMQEDDSKKSSTVKDLERRFPGAIIGASGKKCPSLDEVKELQSSLNAKLGRNTFGIKHVPSRSYGDKIYVIVPEQVINLLEAKGPVGIAAEATSTEDISF